MSNPRIPRNNRKRVDDYYGVHDTGMATPAPAPPPPVAPPVAPPVPPAPAPPAPSRPTPPRRMSPKPDPLTDPLTSETFEGVQPEPDTFDAAVTGGFGYSEAAPTEAASASPSATGFEPGYDQFAPPRFEPRAEGRPADETVDGAAEAAAVTDEPVTPPAEYPDGYIDVEVVDVVDVPHESPPARETLAIDAYPYTQIDETYVDPTTLPEPKEPGTMTDFNESLAEAMTIDGALGVALVDAGSGMALATAGSPAGFNLEVAAAGNSALVQAMGRTISDLELDDHIEDILITLGSQYQIVRPIRQSPDELFLYLVLDRARANLAMARFRLTKLAEQIEI